MNESTSDASTRMGEEEDYEVFRLSIGWGMLSILVFVLILALQVFDTGIWGLSSGQAVAATLPLSVIGFVLGLLGVKYNRGQSSARIGVFLNGAALFCIFVLLPITSQVVRRLN